MLWYKAWLDTRWRFIIGLALVICTAAGPLALYGDVLDKMIQTRMAARGAAVTDPAQLEQLVRMAHLPPAAVKALHEQLQALTSFHAYVWTQVFQKNLVQLWTIFACLLGCGGLAAQARGGGALFTLSLPVSRSQVLWSRTLVALAELAAMAVIASLVVPLFAAAIGRSFPVGEALVYGLSLLVAGSVYFSAAVWLSTLFDDLWRPVLISLGLAFATAFIDLVLNLQGRSAFIDVLSASSFYHGGQPPWLGLLLSAAASAALLYAADRTLARRDF